MPQRRNLFWMFGRAKTGLLGIKKISHAKL
jgi:hypothetical protein